MNRKFVLFLILFFLFGLLLGVTVMKMIDKPDSNYILMNGQRVEIQGGISYVSLMNLEQELRNTPGYNKSATIVLCSDGFEHNGEIVAGYYKDGVIYLDRAYIKEATLHEIGHVIDENLGNISQGEKFLAIYNSVEHKNYHTNSPEEFFAESYKDYIKGKLRNIDVIEFFDGLFE